MSAVRRHGGAGVCTERTATMKVLLQYFRQCVGRLRTYIIFANVHAAHVACASVIYSPQAVQPQTRRENVMQGEMQPGCSAGGPVTFTLRVRSTSARLDVSVAEICCSAVALGSRRIVSPSPSTT